jgi:RNA recognition motif-containing protein
MNIVVDSISSSASEEQLRQLFERYGAVESVHFVKDKHSGIRNGQGYVLMPSDDEAEQAIMQLDGTDFEGQPIQVRQSENADFPTGDFW